MAHSVCLDLVFKKRMKMCVADEINSPKVNIYCNIVKRAMKEAIANGLVIEGEEKRSQKRSYLTIFDQKPSNMTENDEEKVQKPSFLTDNEFPSMIVKNVYEALKLNRKAKYSWLQDNLGVSESTILRAINDLKELGYINPEHSKIKGEWQLLK